MFVDEKVFAINPEQQQTIFENKIIIEQKDLTQPKHNFISLHESVSIDSADEKKSPVLQNIQHNVINLIENISINSADEKKNSVLQNNQHNVVDLVEKVSVLDIPVDDSVIILIKGNDERQTLMERIFDRSKFNRIILDSTKYSVEDDLSLDSLSDKPQSETSNNDLVLKIEQGLPIFLIDFSITEKQLDTLYESVDEVTDQIIITTTWLFDLSSPMFMLVLPLAGFVLIRIENVKLSFNSVKRFFCYVFISILISSAVITPMSISSAYWGYAFAEELSIDNQTSNVAVVVETTPEPMEPVNSTSIEPKTLSDLIPKESVDTLEATILENFQNIGGSESEPIESVNATTVEPVNATVEPINATSVEPVNATSVEPVDTTSVEPVNATSVEPVNATTVEPINATSVEPVNATSVEPVNATSVEPVNATSVEPVNATSVEPVNGTTIEPVNGTTIEPVNGTTIEPVNGTTIEPVNGTTIEPVNGTTITTIEPVNGTTIEPVNGTTIEPVDSNATSIEPEPEPEVIIPEATISLQFDDPLPETITENGTSINNSTENIPEETLELSGDGDFIQIKNVTVTNDLEGLTVTAWVKPDYSAGSPEFTVISKEKSFSLTINNIIQPNYVAKFSVFDSIKWTTVQSNSTIPEKWTFLSATFNGETISIYVSATKENTEEIVGIPTLSISGKLVTTTVEAITSEEDIVVGASITTKEQNSTPSNQFSGEIDDVSLYDYVLNDEQIRAIYEQTREAYESIDNTVELTIEEIIAQIEAELAQNATEAIIIENFQNLGGSTPEPVNVNVTMIETIGVDATSVESIGVNATTVEPVNATSVEPVNATSVEPVNANVTMTETIDVNATTVEPVNATTVEPVNANVTMTETIGVNATTVEPVNATTVEPVNVNVTMIETIGVNATSVESIGVNATTVEPVNATAIIQPLTELQVVPVLTSMKETYLISEDAELELEFYAEYDVLMNELTELDNAMQLLTIDVNQTLQETTIALDPAANQTSSNPVLNFINILFSIPQAEAANLNDEDASKIEIENTKDEIKKLKAQIKALKEDPSLTKEEIKEAKAQLKKVIKQIKATASQVSKTELKDDGAKLQKEADDVEKVGGVEPE